MTWQEIKDEFNIKKQADELGVSIWQAPSFLFILMGLIIIAAMTAVYFISRNYDAPEVIILSESSVVAILFTIGNFIINDIERIARANKMKTEFVSIASHQLKTPLTEINWEVELLMSKCSVGLDQKQCELIEGVANATRKMTRLVNDLLDVARIDQGRLSLEREPMSLEKVLTEVVQGNQVIAKTNRVLLEYTPNETFPMVIGDKRKLAVVFDNLISNAIKYITNGGKVSVRAEQANKAIVVTISDNGVGIPQREHDKIFQKFYRIENAAKNQTEGTGLGLFISKNIIEQSGGSIWFESQEGKGTTFWVSLPIA